MNVSSYAPNLSYHISQLSPPLSPRSIWGYYVQYLWNYQPNSWVARIASVCRVLAILISFPIVVLALLDISSYGIARTLGVIDDVRASTSDMATLHQDTITPSRRLQESLTPQSDSSYPYSDQSDTEHAIHIKPDRQLSHLGVSQPFTFFASEDHNLKLSGVGVFSPATSRPPSPTISRKSLFLESRGSGQEDERLNIRQRARQNASAE
ncbi:hypothetical protein L208DRAFT_1357331 [Tricholoma matsutake]|nr:hypothetical protein L208DRAFT_1357331 [Tricholoma matsutake 945]